MEMTKQEEIREGIAQIICDLGNPKWQHCLLVADTILTNLHLKDVVIKVDRKIEETCDCCRYNEWDDDGLCLTGCLYDDRCWFWEPKDDYVAVIPLIKE